MATASTPYFVVQWILNVSHVWISVRKQAYRSVQALPGRTRNLSATTFMQVKPIIQSLRRREDSLATRSSDDRDRSTCKAGFSVPGPGLFRGSLARRVLHKREPRTSKLPTVKHSHRLCSVSGPLIRLPRLTPTLPPHAQHVLLTA